MIAWIVATSPARRARQEAVDDVPVEVSDHRHAGPGAAEERVHDDDPGRQELDVGAGAAAQRRDAREQLPVEEQPDHRLDEKQRDPDRLAHQVPHLAPDEEPRVHDRPHAASSGSRVVGRRRRRVCGPSRTS
jgi:hypothetical protein